MSESVYDRITTKNNAKTRVEEVETKLALVVQTHYVQSVILNGMQNEIDALNNELADLKEIIDGN